MSISESVQNVSLLSSVQPLCYVPIVGTSETGLKDLNSLNGWSARVKPESCSLHHQRYRLSAADAQTCDAAPQIQIFERINQCRENPRATGANRMAQSDGAASDIDFSRIEAEFSIDSNGNDCKSFVDLEQVH